MLGRRDCPLWQSPYPAYKSSDFATDKHSVLYVDIRVIDEETQLYWLFSRYYDPETGRFISLDSIEYLDPGSINELNLYCYYMNNPIMYADPSGHMPAWLQWTLGGLIIVGAIALSICTAGLATPIAIAVGGGVFGAIVGGVVVGAIGGAIAGFGISVGAQAITNGFEDIDWNAVGKSTVSGAILDLLLVEFLAE